MRLKIGHIEMVGVSGVQNLPVDHFEIGVQSESLLLTGTRWVGFRKFFSW